MQILKDDEVSETSDEYAEKNVESLQTLLFSLFVVGTSGHTSCNQLSLKASTKLSTSLFNSIIILWFHWTNRHNLLKKCIRTDW